MQMHCYLFQSTLDKPCRVHSRLDHVFAVTLIYGTPTWKPERHCQTVLFLQ
jgi:hypothetical protein